MKVGDKQLGKPQILYKNTKANIEALTGIVEGATAYATDTDQIGSYSGSAWAWINSGAASDHGALTGLSDDDHSQYHTDGRADTWLNAKSANYYPASETIAYGTKTAGGYADLAVVGGTDMTIQEANGANAMLFTLGFTSVALAPNNILIYGYYAGGANHQIEVSAYNYVSAAYEHMGFITTETSKHWYSLPIFNGTSFIDGSNNASLRFRHIQAGVNTHYLYLDYVALQHTLSVAGSGGVTDHGALQNLDHPDHPASAIVLDTAAFDNNLSATDDTVQKAFDTLDELVAAGTATGISVDTSNFDTNLSSADDTVQKALDTLDELVAGGGGGYYEPITTGDINAPELVFADGDVVMASGSPSAFGVAPTDGWTEEEDEVWTYASADDPTYTLTIPGNKTGKYFPGMRYRLTQTTVKYFIITAVSYAAPNTTITLYGGTDYDLANAAITNTYYSHLRNPAGFPPGETKWSVILEDSSDAVIYNPVNGTWYYSGSLNITVPIGLWDVEYEAEVFVYATPAQVLQVYWTLSTTTNSETDNRFTYQVAEYNAEWTITTIHAKQAVSVAVKTPHYLIWKPMVATLDQVNYMGSISKTILRAKCAHL